MNAAPEFQKGRELIAKANCLSCHKEQEKLVGPAYSAVAEDPEYREFMITVKYPKGKEFLLKTWLDKLVLIARSIGLEVGK